MVQIIILIICYSTQLTQSDHVGTNFYWNIKRNCVCVFNFHNFHSFFSNLSVPLSSSSVVETLRGNRKSDLRCDGTDWFI